MSPTEINDAINADLFENAFARQKEHPVAYHSKAPAEKLESLLYYCPDCKKLGTLRSEKARFRCSCGFETTFTEQGFFDPAAPFETVLEWDAWQQGELKQNVEIARAQDITAPLFSDDALEFHRIAADHQTISLGTVRLTQYADRLAVGDQAFALSEIHDMAMVQNCRLLFTSQENYYEVIAKKGSGVNLRKYLDLWQCSQI